MSAVLDETRKVTKKNNDHVQYSSSDSDSEEIDEERNLVLQEMSLLDFQNNSAYHLSNIKQILNYNGSSLLDKCSLFSWHEFCETIRDYSCGQRAM